MSYAPESAQQVYTTQKPAMFIQILRRQHEIDRRGAFVQFAQAEVRRTQGALHGGAVQPFGVRDRGRDNIARGVLAGLKNTS